MATKLYLGSNNAGAVPFPPSVRGAWDQQEGFISRRITPDGDRYGSGAGGSLQVVETSTTNDWDVLMYQGISAPLASSQTISGTLNLMLAARESSPGANIRTHLFVWVMAEDGSNRGTLLADYVEALTNEWPGTVFTGHELASAQALSSVVGLTGDRVVVEVGYCAGNTFGTSQYGELWVGGDSLSPDAVDGVVGLGSAGSGIRPYLTFSQDIAFEDDWLANHTRLYLTGHAAPATPPADRGAWDDSSSDVTMRLDEHPGWTTPAIASDSEATATGEWDLLLYRGVSGQLDGDQTISGSLNAVIGVAQSSTGNDMVYHVHAYVMAPDGSVRGTLLADYVEALSSSSEWFNGSANATQVRGQDFAVAQSLASVAAQSGDRIVVEVGARALNVVTTSYQAFLSYGGNPTYPDHVDGSSQSVQGGLSYLVFSQDISFGPTEAQVAQLVTHSVVSFATEAQVAQLVALAVIANYDPLGVLSPINPHKDKPNAPGGKPGPGKGGQGKPNRPILGGNIVPRKLRLGGG